ncbi:S8 family peptidase [Hymenobacter latericus]|uniref:S8 family peptidase n=1 Tax=Hymenobacter sp. YIM 151858-1 TaxID=2987688 RepID=UPI00222626D0|nr:S8 family serine peptidase [Hymenobacter sp. YIM 151858-1]UYZ60244.1 S8 family serine peptidase [Hymenobacter sp. YIM 151858-1]
MRISSLGVVLGLVAGTVAYATTPPQRPTATVRRHLVYFKDKAGTPFTVSQPRDFLSERALQRRQRQGIAVQARDLPVSPAYTAQVKSTSGVRLLYTSRWFNAAVVECDSAALGRLQGLPFVRAANTLNRTAQTAPAQPTAAPTVAARTTAERDPSYGPGFWQADMLGAVTMHKAGYRGENMHIAVFDAGFPGVDQMGVFQAMRSEGRLLSTFDFVDRDKSVFEKSSHGTLCLSTMAGNQPGTFIGTAPKASYHLMITEDTRSEQHIEEVNWLLAAEYADSVGVDIISSSLGYNTFDAPSRDYSYQDMNGRTAIASRAATMAARTGILVVNSAGNDGANGWRYIGAPADADSVLTVGAVDSLRQQAVFSSIGPTADGRIKPNVAAQGVASVIVNTGNVLQRGNGTSYACPITAGMAAGFWQANPTLSAQQVIEWLQRSASQANRPDNLQGYGIPSFTRAYNLLHPNNPLSTRSSHNPGGEMSIFPNPAGRELALQLPEEFRRKPLRVRITDAKGALVKEMLLAPSSGERVPLRLGSLKPGEYICTVQAGSSTPPRSVRFVQQ